MTKDAQSSEAGDPAVPSSSSIPELPVSLPSSSSGQAESSSQAAPEDSYYLLFIPTSGAVLAYELGSVDEVASQLEELNKDRTPGEVFLFYGAKLTITRVTASRFGFAYGGVEVTTIGRSESSFIVQDLPIKE